jgi:hypothetical protein
VARRESWVGNFGQIPVVFREVRAKRHAISEFVATAVLVVMTTAPVPAATAAAQGSQVIASADRAWALSHVASVQGAAEPVASPGTPYAYDIVVTSTAPTSLVGHLARVYLATGQAAYPICVRPSRRGQEGRGPVAQR